MTMLEKAARAAWRADPENYGTEDDHWRSYVELVRAVLMAVREPDADMSRAGGKTFNQTPAPNPVFTAMIDAILNQDPTA